MPLAFHLNGPMGGVVCALAAAGGSAAGGWARTGLAIIETIPNAANNAVAKQLKFNFRMTRLLKPKQLPATTFVIPIMLMLRRNDQDAERGIAMPRR
jgi:hypothetical protein